MAEPTPCCWPSTGGHTNDRAPQHQARASKAHQQPAHHHPEDRPPHATGAAPPHVPCIECRGTAEALGQGLSHYPRGAQKVLPGVLPARVHSAVRKRKFTRCTMGVMPPRFRYFLALAIAGNSNPVATLVSDFLQCKTQHANHDHHNPHHPTQPITLGRTTGNHPRAGFAEHQSRHAQTQP